MGDRGPVGDPAGSRIASEITQGSGSPLRARLQTDLERLGSLVLSRSKLLCSKHVEDELMLMPARWGWVLLGAWHPVRPQDLCLTLVGEP